MPPVRAWSAASDFEVVWKPDVISVEQRDQRRSMRAIAARRAAAGPGVPLERTTVNGQQRLPSRRQRGSLVVGVIVAHDDRRRGKRLCSHRCQSRAEGPRRVVGGDHDGDAMPARGCPCGSVVIGPRVPAGIRHGYALPPPMISSRERAQVRQHGVPHRRPACRADTRATSSRRPARTTIAISTPPSGLIDVAAEAGADAVKFQTYTAEGLYSRRTPDMSYLKDQGLVGERESVLGADQASRDSVGMACGPRRPREASRYRVLLDAIPGGGGRSPRRDWRSRVQDRLVRGESPAAHRARGPDRQAAADLHGHGFAGRHRARPRHRRRRRCA